jgi:hypothetical protein
MMMFRLRTTGLSGWTGSGLGAMPMLRWLGWGVSGALVILGCWLAVRLLTGFTTPLPPPRQLVLQAPVAVAARLAEQALLGYAAPAEFSSTLPAGASTLQNLQLLGVWSSKVSAEARAILRQDGGGAPLVLAIGDELASGIRLVAIAPGEITLAAPGREVTLTLPRPATAPASTDKN